MPWKNKQLIICIGCGEQHLTFRPDKTKYCSIKCARKLQVMIPYTEERRNKVRESNLKTYEKIKYRWQKENHPNWGKSYNAGASHPNWKNGISDKNKSERARFRRQLQHIILKRDNYTCQICDQYSGNLQIDHIKPWAEYPELRFDLDNCRTLCMSCHYYITFKRKLPKGMIWGHNLSRRIS